MSLRCSVGPVLIVSLLKQQKDEEKAARDAAVAAEQAAAKAEREARDAELARKREEERARREAVKKAALEEANKREIEKKKRQAEEREREEEQQRKKREREEKAKREREARDKERKEKEEAERIAKEAKDKEDKERQAKVDEARRAQEAARKEKEAAAEVERQAKQALQQQERAKAAAAKQQAAAAAAAAAPKAQPARPPPSPAGPSRNKVPTQPRSNGPLSVPQTPSQATTSPASLDASPVKASLISQSQRPAQAQSQVRPTVPLSIPGKKSSQQAPASQSFYGQGAAPIAQSAQSYQARSQGQILPQTASSSYGASSSFGAPRQSQQPYGSMLAPSPSPVFSTSQPLNGSSISPGARSFNTPPQMDQSMGNPFDAPNGGMRTAPIGMGFPSKTPGRLASVDEAFSSNPAPVGGPSHMRRMSHNEAPSSMLTQQKPEYRARVDSMSGLGSIAPIGRPRPANSLLDPADYPATGSSALRTLSPAGEPVLGSAALGEDEIVPAQPRHVSNGWASSTATGQDRWGLTSPPSSIWNTAQPSAAPGWGAPPAIGSRVSSNTLGVAPGPPNANRQQPFGSIGSSNVFGANAPGFNQIFSPPQQSPHPQQHLS